MSCASNAGVTALPPGPYQKLRKAGFVKSGTRVGNARLTSSFCFECQYVTFVENSGTEVGWTSKPNVYVCARCGFRPGVPPAITMVGRNEKPVGVNGENG